MICVVKNYFFIKYVCSENGQLLVDGPGAGYLLLKSRDDYIEQARDLCCGNESDALGESCESFYQMNSPDNCSSYVPSVVCKYFCFFKDKDSVKN
jgi:hypothetical protein